MVKEEKVLEMGSLGEKNENPHHNGLAAMVLSWNLDDIFNGKLYKDKVGKIPRTFSSASHYLKSFIYPLVEETHADMLSSMTVLPQAPMCKILRINESKHFKPPNKLFYDVTFELQRDDKKEYMPQGGDVLALSAVRPRHVGDLNRPPISYLPVVVQKVDENNPFVLNILASKPIMAEQDKKKKTESLFAIFLINITTNTRIWKALLGGKMNLIENILSVNSVVGDSCDTCSSREIFGKHRLLPFNLNKSQINAILDCIATTQCTHKKSVRLIWGPPGTGKTKTVGALLWLLLKMKCKTLTCAPTNISVLEVTSRLVRLMESHQTDCYGFGDILLFGNGERMKLDDHDDLLNVFLDYRVDKLEKCFDPLTGWNHLLNSMIWILDDFRNQYLLYLENPEKGILEREQDLTENSKEESQKKKGKGKNNPQNVKKAGKNKTSEAKGSTQKQKRNEYKKAEDDLAKNKGSVKLEDGTNDTVLSFAKFIKKFCCIEKDLRYCMLNLCTHLPTSLIPVGVVENMRRAISLLKSLRSLVHSNILSNEEMEKSLNSSGDVKYTASVSAAPLLTESIKECLQSVTSLRGAFSLPNIFDQEAIRRFCFQNACLVFCTASSSAKVRWIKQFELVVIDEASQLKECESAIPLQVPGIRNAILIGDERQLPAMIKSKISEKAELGRSMFERLVQLGHRKHLLNTQYRMHPSISLFPNSEFYGKQIFDAPSVKEESYKKHFLPGNMYGSYSFINVAYGKEEFDYSYSHKNLVEVALVCEMVAWLYKASVDTRRIVRVGVISPYKAQVFAIQERLGNKYATHSNFSVSIRSVDGFQGGEEDIIIISTVRSNGKGSVGFLSNRQRTNVALTRARHCLWILGNGSTLTNSNSVWKKLILDAKDRGCFFDADKDERMFKVITDSMVDLHKLDELLNPNSILFQGARWKVIICDDFWSSLEGIKQVEVHKKLVSLLIKLSSGWRRPPQEQRNQNILDGNSMLEQYNVTRKLNVLWTVDIMKEGTKLIQVLKFWDILPLPEVPRLAKQLEIISGSYTVDIMNRCKYRCLEGNLEVPMSWDMSGKAVKRGKTIRTELSTQLASLNLGAKPRKAVMPEKSSITEHLELSTQLASLNLGDNPTTSEPAPRVQPPKAKTEWKAKSKKPKK